MQSTRNLSFKEKSFWDDIWNDRLVDGGFNCNGPKFFRLLKILWNKAHFAPKEKLEIGCGAGVHAMWLAEYSPYWRTKWEGIDLSEVAIERAKSWGLNASVCNFTDFKSDKKFELFLFLDVLEHIEDHAAVAEKIKELGADKYTVFGNCPLYLAEDESHEREINIHTVKAFMNNAGCEYFIHEIYGITGMPYITFEGTNKGKPENWLDIPYKIGGGKNE